MNAFMLMTHPDTEMKLIVASIYTNYTTWIIDDTGIEQIDAYTAGPKAEQLLLRFERAESI